MKITAKVTCVSREPCGTTQSTIRFGANYADKAGNRINREWAAATPSFSLSMVVLNEVPFEAGKAYTLTFDDGE